ncbi:MAG TPA: efflux RND transporter permease subunit, partial [Nevskiaceae bacterium]|nr:efflux RND transporter permease subunit [Nevskiaceae bacterium]
AQVTVIGGEVAQWEVQPDDGRRAILGVSVAQIEQALRGSGTHPGGGLHDVDGHETIVRGIGSTIDPDSLGSTVVDARPAGPVTLDQVARVVEGAKVRRGAAGTDANPAVILAVQKQPGVDTLAVTAAVESRLHALDGGLPSGSHRVTAFRQADFIEASVHNVRDALLHGALIVALVLVVFLSGARAAPISLTAIPLSMAGALAVLAWLGLSIDTLTLGGLAIAVGELVDDAIVGVENVARRLRESPPGAEVLRVVARATIEMRAGILHATLVVIAGFVPLFALGGVEGRLFASLATAYVAAILASLLVACTVTPVLCALGFGRRGAALPHERAWLVRLQQAYATALRRVLARPFVPLAVAAALPVVATLLALHLPRHFLPALNETTLTVNLALAPGLSLSESDRVGAAAENLIRTVPGVAGTARRTGRAELDEHAEGVHYSEIDVRLAADALAPARVGDAIREHLAVLPGQVTIGAPIGHRIDHLLSGVRAPLAVKIEGDDLDTIAAATVQVQSALADVPGLALAGLDAQGRLREVQIRVNAAAAAQAGVSPPQVLEMIAGLDAGRWLATLAQPDRRTDLVLRASPEARDPRRLADRLVDTPTGPVPLGWIAHVDEVSVPDRIARENGRRRAVIAAFPVGEGIDEATAVATQRVAALHLPPGIEVRVEGEAAARRAALQRIAALAGPGLLLMSTILYLRFGRVAPVAIVLANLPIAAACGLLALAITQTPLSVASVVGLVTLAGIAARNSILKLSRYQDLENHGRRADAALVVQGAVERLTPVLMTALVAALCLVPLLIGDDDPGKEVLHPVAVALFGGLIGGTLIDSFVTPALYVLLAPRIESSAASAPGATGISICHASPSSDDA